MAPISRARCTVLPEQRIGWPIVDAWVITPDVCAQITVHANVIFEAHPTLGEIVGMSVNDFYRLATSKQWRIKKLRVE